MPSDEFMAALEFLFVNQFDDLCKVGAIQEYNAILYGVSRPFHGKRFEPVDGQCFPQHMEAISKIENEPFTLDVAREFDRRMNYARNPSKAWEPGSPYRRLIYFHRKCLEAIRSDEKKAAEQRKIERKKNMQDAEIALRSKRARRNAMHVMRSVKIAGFTVRQRANALHQNHSPS